MNKLKIFYLTFIFLLINAIGESAPHWPWDQIRPEIPSGKLFKYQMKSRALKNKREIWVYTPNEYDTKKEVYPLVIIFDGQAYVSDLIPGPTILDNLIGEAVIPPVIAVFISSIDQTARNRELPCYPPFINFLTTELLPWLRKSYSITNDPSQTIVVGSSYGGLAAGYASLTHPELFGNVLSQSGAFWWSPSKVRHTQWLIQQFNNAPKLPIQFYLDVGNQEVDEYAGTPSMITINRNFRDLLRAKGYPVHYAEFNGGHDYACWRRTFSQGLIALIGQQN